ncbi:dTDP-4-dehydrorhamnose 3,5-epimerase [Aurantimicrobium minutum]|uniref:dTDP-4-dehydrorhamnose 3,5-epimerase family protein n=1 Tax=Aurantimicrobium minutum TaxID=708131 RepID=UPI00240614EF|nr:dTDP-4-dehydrorhamnose 3,5-epimerase family protein [Aurantimicrobium minutum]MDF9810502.1 dTDP-4-dehydrorhamnose 3,5-epimerase [Aurantimicrobium minutum]
MKYRELSISGAYEISLAAHVDSRGFFSELFKQSQFQMATGSNFIAQQLNLSESKLGVLRGIHFADVPKGQAKYVQVLSGRIRDYVIDLRVGSSTFGKWEAVTLTSPASNAVFLPEGVGHAFLALEDKSLVAYMVSSEFNPESEHAINPLDPDLNLDFNDFSEDIFISDKDKNAPGFLDLIEAKRLPSLEECDLVRSLYIENEAT